MKKIAFLASAQTLNSSRVRRADAFEHDAQLAALNPAFRSKGMILEEMDRKAAIQSFAECGGAIIATPWDYHQDHLTFLSKLRQIEVAGTQCFNSPDLVSWTWTNAISKSWQAKAFKLFQQSGQIILGQAHW